MSTFTVTELPLPGLKRLARRRFEDQRGRFSRLFCPTALQQAGWQGPVAQINHSVTHHEGTVRGLHYQRPPHEEMKLVSCLHGRIWDLVVDLRPDSPTFLRWHAETLDADEDTALLIPTGFAHGFQTLTSNVELLYCHSAGYEPAFEAGLRIDDPALAIPWPLAVKNLSKRDQEYPLIEHGFEGVSR